MSNTVVSIPIARKIVTGLCNGSSVMTRPSDVNAYTAGDEVSDNTTGASAHPWVFANVASRPGGLFTIRGLLLSTSGTAALFSGGRLALYIAAPTMAGDNAAHGNSADRSTFIASITSSPWNGVTTATPNESFGVLTSLVSAPLVCGATSTIYGVLIASGGSTPASAQTFTCRLIVDQGV